MKATATERWYGCYGAPRDGLFTRASNRHPAKMAVDLAVRILEHGERRGYWKKGDVLLDPMAGIGTTLVVGAALGYRVVGVELERHFFDMAVANARYARRKFQGTGGCAIICGDATDLSGVLAEAVVASPPYPSAFREEHSGTAGGKVTLEPERGGSFRGYAGAVASPPYGDSDVTGQGHFRSLREPTCANARENPHEGYSGAVLSPPYGDQQVIAGAGMTARILREARDRGIDAAVKLYRETVIDRQKAHGRWSDENIRSHIEAALATRESGYSAIVTSPPHADTSMPGMVSAAIRQLARGGKWDEAISAMREVDRAFVAKKKRRGPHTDAYLRQAIEWALERESGNYGARVPDAVVTSPSCSQAQSGTGMATTGYGDGSEKVGDRTYQPQPQGQTTGQIGNLRDSQGDVDAILCSPPWQQQGAQQIYDRGKGFHSYGPNEPKDRMKKDYLRGEATGQVGNLPDPEGNVDAVLSSPPYGPRDDHGADPHAERMEGAANQFRGYPAASEGQIGASRNGETYCSAMLRVYQQMHAVLKPGAVVCLVTKNPVKRGKIRRLDEDTIRLMAAAGFMLIERIYAMLAEEKGTQLRIDGGAQTIRVEHKSFFKRLYERTHPELRVDHEDCLFFRRR